jgi:hypothetical protein
MIEMFYVNILLDVQISNCNVISYFHRKLKVKFDKGISEAMKLSFADFGKDINPMETDELPGENAPLTTVCSLTYMITSKVSLGQSKPRRDRPCIG